MFRLIHGNLFDSHAQTMVNAVNCAGVMGAGIAMEFKRRFPVMFSDYQSRCRAGAVKLGQPYLFAGSNPWVLNFPTKAHWRDKSHISDIQSGLEYFMQHYRAWGITSIAFPALGCGLGGLNKADVTALLQRYFQDVAIDVDFYL